MMNQKDIHDLFQRKYSTNNIDLCRDRMESFLTSLLKLLFPVLCNHSPKTEELLASKFSYLKGELEEILDCLEHELHRDVKKEDIINDFFANIAGLENQMNQDAEFIFKSDPAAQSVNEVVICYPGFYAIATYRIAKFFHNKKLPLFARILTEYAHRQTGVDIHPGATIGCPFFIDHATGVVIGESTEIGKRVKVYQGVTLGANSVEKKYSGTKRHPTIEDDVIIYSNATILGGDTIVGKNSVIGGNVWLLHSVPENSKIFYKNE
jgi:serine O-acetyltransferase